MLPQVALTAVRSKSVECFMIRYFVKNASQKNNFLVFQLNICDGFSKNMLKHMLKVMVKKILQLYAEDFCLSKPVMINNFRMSSDSYT